MEQNGRKDKHPIFRKEIKMSFSFSVRFVGCQVRLQFVKPVVSRTGEWAREIIVWSIYTMVISILLPGRWDTQFLFFRKERSFTFFFIISHILNIARGGNKIRRSDLLRETPEIRPPRQIPHRKRSPPFFKGRIRKSSRQ